MKHTILIMTIMFVLVNTQVVLAQEQVITDIPAKSGISATGTTFPAYPESTRPMPGKGMMHKGKGQHGKGHGGMKHGGGQHGKGQHEKQEQLVQRLDMIEARMAKIETMLEILIRR